MWSNLRVNVGMRALQGFLARHPRKWWTQHGLLEQVLSLERHGRTSGMLASENTTSKRPIH